MLRRNNVHLTGSGTRPLIFAHGFGCDQTVWRFVAPHFERDYAVVLFDHMGSGGSDRTAYDQRKYATLAGYADDLLAICDELALQGATVVGHSAGAAIAIEAAVARPGLFRTLVLIGPSPRYVDDGDYVGGFSRDDLAGLLDVLDANYPEWARATAPLIMGNPDRPELGIELTERFCRMDPDIAREFARVCFLSDIRADLPLVQPPALVMQCSRDMLAPVSVGEYVSRALPHGELVVMRATGHCPHLSEPEETTDSIRAFLDARNRSP